MTDNQHKLLFYIIDGSYKITSVGSDFSIQKVKGTYPITGFVQNITKSNFYFANTKGQIFRYNTQTQKFEKLNIPNLGKYSDIEHHQVGDTLWQIAYNSSDDKEKNVKVAVYDGNVSKVNIFDINYTFISNTKIKAYADEKKLTLWFTNEELDLDNLNDNQKFEAKLIYVDTDGNIRELESIDGMKLGVNLNQVAFDFIGGSNYVLTYAENKSGDKPKTYITVGNADTGKKYMLGIEGIKSKINVELLESTKFPTVRIYKATEDNKIGLEHFFVITYDNRLGIPPTLAKVITPAGINSYLIGSGGYLQFGKGIKVQLPDVGINWDLLISLNDKLPTTVQLQDEYEIKPTDKVKNGVLITKDFFKDFKKVIAEKLGVNIQNNNDIDDMYLLGYGKYVYLVVGNTIKVGRITPNFTKSDLIKPFSGYYYDDKLKVEPIDELEIKADSIYDIKILHSDKGNPYLLVITNNEDDYEIFYRKELNVYRINPKNGKLTHILFINFDDTNIDVDTIENILIAEEPNKLGVFFKQKHSNNVDVFINKKVKRSWELNEYTIELNELWKNDKIKTDILKEVRDTFFVDKGVGKFYQVGRQPIYIHQNGDFEELTDEVIPNPDETHKFIEYTTIKGKSSIIVYKGRKEEFEAESIWWTPNSKILISVC